VAYFARGVGISDPVFHVFNPARGDPGGLVYLPGREDGGQRPQIIEAKLR